MNPKANCDSPSPALRERGGPDPKGREGEGQMRPFAGETLTRLAALATLSRGAGEGQGHS